MQEIVHLKACLQEGRGPQVGEVTCGKSPHLTCKRDHIKMRDQMDGRVIPPKRVTSSTYGPPPPCKQALRWKYCCSRCSLLVFLKRFHFGRAYN